MESLAQQSLASRPLAINDVFSTAPGVYFRYLAPDGDGKVAHVIELNSPTALPQQWNLPELAENIHSGRFERRPTQGLAAAYVDPHPTDERRKKERYSYISALVNKKNEDGTLIPCTAILHRKGRGTRVDEHAVKKGISPQTLMTLLRAYWQGGQTQDALLTRYAEGAKARQASLTSAQTPKPVGSQPADEGDGDKPASRGRRRDDGTGSYYLAGDERELLAKEMKEVFLDKKTMTRRKLYRVLMSRHYSYVDADGKKRLVPPEERPSAKQISYILSQQLRLKEVVTKYSSDAEWKNDHRPITGTILQHALGAGDVFEIDSTIVDLWLVAREDRSKIIGKATLYLVVDRYTRLIVGFHLSLDKPSWANAMEALITVVADKKALCERWGGQYNANVWVAHGILCNKLAADRGSEYLGHESGQLADDVHIKVVNMPAHMSSLKGIVECTFKLLHVSLKDNAAGYEPPENPFKRHGEKCYERDASMTLDELGAEFVDIIELHNLRMHEGMQLDPEIVLPETPPIPVEVWKQDVYRRSGNLRRYDEHMLRHKLLPRKKAVVHQQGILVNKCWYVCPEAFEDEWFVRAGRKRFTVDISYDRRSVNTIYIHNRERSNVPYPAVLSARSEWYRDHSVAEVYAVEDLRKKMRKRADEHNLQLEVALDGRAEERARRYRDLTDKAISQATGQSRHRGAVELRAEEASARALAIADPSSAAVAMPQPTAASPSSKPKGAEQVTSIVPDRPSSRSKPKTGKASATNPTPYTGGSVASSEASRDALLQQLFDDDE